MRLLIDAVMVRSPGMVELRDDLVRAVDERTPEGCSTLALFPDGNTKLSGSRTVRIQLRAKPNWGWFGRWVWYQRILPQLVSRHGAHVIYSLAGLLSTPLIETAGTVVTVNNMLPFSPEILHLQPTLSRNRLKMELLRRLYCRSVAAADAVVFHSTHALDRISLHTGDISKKVLVALTGVPRDILRHSLESYPHPYGNNPYYLFLSAIQPYKNHLKLVCAYRRALDAASKLPDLLLAGFPENPGYLNQIRQTISGQRLHPRVRYLGALNRDDVAAWLSNAEVNYFPSTCETNSLVMAEILGVGGVLACSNIQPMIEVAGNAAEFFDPASVDAMAATILRLHHDNERRASLRALARKRAQELSWDACGDAVWNAARMAYRGYQERRVAKKCHSRTAPF